MTRAIQSAAAWLALLFLFAVILAMRPALSEPGDKYEIRHVPLANKAAGGRSTPPEYATAIGGSFYGRPAQCPRRYCGCSLSLKLFGKIIPTLNLAANWIRTFPRTQPAPGMVAARRGHVMLILSHVQGRNYVVYDPNSGGGLTREHVRSIAGFTVVNPYSRMAAR